MVTVASRFWAKVQTAADGCWLWTGSCVAGGYGHLKVNRRTVYAHRWAYEHMVAPIPPGLQIDHLCRVRNCVNPAHMEPVTPRENVLRGNTIPAALAARTHCVNGHDLALATPVGGERRCTLCRRGDRRAA